MPTTRNKGATQSQVLPTLPLQAQPPVTSDVPDDVARDQTSQAQQPLQSPASLVTQVMQDLFLNPVFQEQIQEMVKSMVKKIVDATYHQLQECTEQNRGAIHDLAVKTDEEQKELKILHKQMETQQGQLETLRRSNNDLEQYSRRNCLRIFGVEEQRNEDPDQLSIDVCKTGFS